MDIVSYSYADKQSKRIDNLFHVGETEAAKVVVGQEWYVPSTGKSYKRVTDGANEAWVEITATSTDKSASVEEYTAGTPSGAYAGSLTVFPVSAGYEVGFVEVYVNGVRWTSEDYTATDGVSVVLTFAAVTGDSIVLRTQSTFKVADAYTKAEVDTGVQVLEAIKRVDGSGSGLDADLLDGLDSTSLMNANTVPVEDGGTFDIADNTVRLVNIADRSGVTNPPPVTLWSGVGIHGTLTTTKAQQDNVTTQMFTSIEEVPGEGTEQYRRTSNGGVWSNWVQVLDSGMDSGWITPTLVNGATVTTADTLKYRKSPDGMVTIVGIIRTLPANGDVMFTLPVGFRSEKRVYAPAENSTQTKVAYIFCDSDGAFRAFYDSGTADWMMVSMSFEAVN